VTAPLGLQNDRRQTRLTGNRRPGRSSPHRHRRPSHPLDAEDPMGPGDVMLWADASDDDSADTGAQHRISDARIFNWVTNGRPRFVAISQYRRTAQEAEVSGPTMAVRHTRAGRLPRWKFVARRRSDSERLNEINNECRLGRDRRLRSLDGWKWITGDPILELAQPAVTTCAERHIDERGSHRSEPTTMINKSGRPLREWCICVKCPRWFINTTAQAGPLGPHLQRRTDDAVEHSTGTRLLDPPVGPRRFRRPQRTVTVRVSMEFRDATAVDGWRAAAPRLLPHRRAKLPPR
jgi:hypothetical protein